MSERQRGDKVCDHSFKAGDKVQVHFSGRHLVYVAANVGPNHLVGKRDRGPTIPVDIVHFILLFPDEHGHRQWWTIVHGDVEIIRDP